MVTQLQSKITIHVLLLRGAFLSPQGTTAAESSTLGQRQQQEGWKMSHTSTAAGREARRKTHSSHQCLQRPLPPTSKLKAGQHLGWPSYPHGQDCVLLSRTGRWCAQPQPSCNESICPHCSVIVHLPLQMHTAAVPGPKCSLPAEIPYSLQSPALQQVWALQKEQRMTSPIHHLALEPSPQSPPKI